MGAFLAFFTVRARRIWVLLAAVPLFANLTLVTAPWIWGSEVRAIRERGLAEPPERDARAGARQDVAPPF